MVEAAKTLVSPNRAQRRRMQTRDKLIEAGRQVFAEKGVDAATIQDITETADVGRGSFYNFFDTKEELVEAIVAELLEYLVQVEAAVSAEYEDPVTALAIALRSSYRVITANEVLAWFIVRTQRIGGPVAEQFQTLTQTLIERGREQGRVKVGDAGIAVVLLGGGMLAAIEMMLVGRLPKDGIDGVVEHMLLGLGVSPAVCRKVMSMPLPPLPMT